MALPARGALLDVHAAGTWTARPELRRTGAQGHPADAVPAGAPPRIAEAYPLGALLIASQSKRVWSYRDFSRTVMSAMIAGQPMVTGPLYARINDAPDGLADNEGSLTLCLETAE
ncbi:hypothetical protein LNKW23_44820 [Paralimibaculum aggregatum]|uniref:Uncharacterized protein n=1 Tax=Paralimibaculum aggregatum TaxID=3036245 RepID=A0ABQ6LT66_9RHOB|nr:hypothetical protein LNKW23_44820 [Limibaculum sp. NKW23]